jgi:hypothetical protein
MLKEEGYNYSKSKKGDKLVIRKGKKLLLKNIQGNSSEGAKPPVRLN